MSRFCVNTNSQPTGEHEVHNLDAGCGHLPDPQNQRFLGSFISCAGAIVEAKKTYGNVDGCAYCASECHTR